MNEYRSELKRRMWVLCVTGAAAVVAMVWVASVGSGGLCRGPSDATGANTGFIAGFRTGILIAFTGGVLTGILRAARAIGSDDILRRLYIAENDERARLIRDKVGGAGLNVILGTLATASVISGFYSEVVFFTLSSVLLFAALVKGVLKVYYTRAL